jgi:PadR family transcriptional regulator PadR
MRRKPGTLLPIETSILAAALDLRARGQDEFHGFFIAKEMQEREEARRLTAHGTLYRALGRLEEAGCLVSRGEDPTDAQRERRPIRRLYRITPLGQRALADAGATHEAAPASLRRGEATRMRSPTHS